MPETDEANRPVFVDFSGRRHRTLRYFGWVLGVLWVGCAGALVFSLADADSRAPQLTIPEVTGDGLSIAHVTPPQLAETTPHRRRRVTPRHRLYRPRTKLGVGTAAEERKNMGADDDIYFAITSWCVIAAEVSGLASVMI
ncbi:hypothetical protein ACIP98_42025 [Streptomyces sp. NPDC088354]|uniref:hypothetical protein n=1 Tax=Streptomyces sp. NPDC088354 TaxID=3365856 RepID=UPI00380E1173